MNDDVQKKLQILRDLLIAENSRYNLTAIKEPKQIEVRHFEDSLAALPILEKYTTADSNKPSLIDIGSGAGFPSLVLAIVLDSWQFTSLEATGKKVKFQQMAAAELGLKNFRVINGRAEELAHSQDFRNKFDVAAVRAVGHFAMIAELAAGFVKNGGLFLAWKSAKVEKELEQSSKILKLLGFDVPQKNNYSLQIMENEKMDCCIVSSIKKTATTENYPRNFSVIKANISALAT